MVCAGDQPARKDRHALSILLSVVSGRHVELLMYVRCWLIVTDQGNFDRNTDGMWTDTSTILIQSELLLAYGRINRDGF